MLEAVDLTKRYQGATALDSILRALGARRGTVFAAIVLEATTITTLGPLAGYIVYGAILGGAFVVIRAQTGVFLNTVRFDSVLVWAPIAMIVLGGLSASCRPSRPIGRTSPTI